MDTIYSDVPAHDDGIPGHGGCKMAQLFAGVSSHFLKLVPMSSKKAMPHALEDFIHDHGAMKGLRSDNAKAKLSKSINNILRMYCIEDNQNEPHYQHQNPVKRHVQDVKRMSHNIMD